VVEANFFRDQEAQFAALPAHRLVQLHCHAPLAVLSERYANRLPACRTPRRGEDQRAS
jgi:hypothetical protein